MPLKIKFPWDYSQPLPVRKRGNDLIRDPMLNKSSAFTERERSELKLHGLLPVQVNTIEEQARRIYGRIHGIADPLDKYMALSALQERNEQLYFRVLGDHIEELMPIVYTPTVGLATSNFSHVFQRGRGLWITPGMRGHIGEIMRDALADRHITLIVATDNEAILGIGDQGAGGMAISVGKLALYTACAGIHPASVLPVSLDVGTDNQKLLEDPMYLGWREPRLRGAAYDELIEEFIGVVAADYPGTLVQWEDFRKDNALRILDRYRERLPSFNDDIQGTGAVALAGVRSACPVWGAPLVDQRIVVLGAGAAGLGISRQIKAGLQLEGLSADEATGRVAVLDSRGLLIDSPELRDAYKREMAWSPERAAAAGLPADARHDLQAVVERFRPSVLIGASGQAGAFDERIVAAMLDYMERPAILPFSNPTDISEARPADIIRWSSGRALIATGSPFPAVEYAGRRFEVGQGNNVFVFPGLGLGALLSRASVVTDGMISAAAQALAGMVSDNELGRGLLYPSIKRLREAAAVVATAVMHEAISEGVAGERPDDPEACVRRAMWEPRYPRYVAAD